MSERPGIRCLRSSLDELADLTCLESREETNMTSPSDRPNTALVARDAEGWQTAPELHDRIAAVAELAAVDVATQGVPA
jgi:hypothetical protein